MMTISQQLGILLIGLLGVLGFIFGQMILQHTPELSWSQRMKLFIKWVCAVIISVLFVYVICVQLQEETHLCPICHAPLPHNH